MTATLPRHSPLARVPHPPLAETSLDVVEAALWRLATGPRDGYTAATVTWLLALVQRYATAYAGRLSRAASEPRIPLPRPQHPPGDPAWPASMSLPEATGPPGETPEGDGAPARDRTGAPARDRLGNAPARDREGDAVAAAPPRTEAPPCPACEARAREPAAAPGPGEPGPPLAVGTGERVPAGAQRCARCERVFEGGVGFYRDTHRASGYQRRCKACVREARRGQRAAHARERREALARAGDA